MTRGRNHKHAVLIGGAVALLAAGITPASAHYVYQDGFVYESPGFDQCVYAYAESSHGESGDGYTKGTVAAYRSYVNETSNGNYTVPCDSSTNDQGTYWYRPSSNIEIKTEYFRLKNNPGDKSFPKNWSLCEYSDWVYNQKSAYKLTIAGEMRGPTICGASYYGTLTSAAVNNGGWLRGTVWSGGHKLPASPSASPASPASTANAAGPYDGIDGFLAGTSDGELGTDGMINPPLGDVTIAGPDGNPVLNPATGQPVLVDLNAFNTPPTNVPGDTTQVVTNLAGDPTTVIRAGGPPAAPSQVVVVAGSLLGQEYYVVPMHIGAEAVLDAP